LIIEAKFLDNLDRSFSRGDDRVLEVDIQLSDEDYKAVLENVQVGGIEAFENNESFKTVANITITTGIVVNYFPNSTFKTAGNFARSFGKPGFNIDLSDSFCDRKSFRLRTDATDLSHLRQKVVCDMLNRIGLPSIQATYVRLTINDELYGLYLLLDTLKSDNIKEMYKTETEKDKLQLYKCKEVGFDFTSQSANLCTNASSENETDITEFEEFIARVEEAKTIDQLDEIMNVDIFLKYMAVDWIIGSFDHLLVLGHNFYFYKNDINKKWDIIYYDFDNTLGQGLSDWAWTFNGDGKNKGVTDFTKLNFKQFTLDQKIFDVLVNNDDTRFKNNLKEVLIAAFNPKLLNDHIDELKSYITPYVKEEYTPINGEYPGRVNKKGFALPTDFSVFEKNSEYETVAHEEMVGQLKVPGIKQFIKDSFENVCKLYNFDMDKIINESIHGRPLSFFTKIKNHIHPYDDNVPYQVVENTVPDDACWSKASGYSCCEKCNVVIVENGKRWGVENGKWCGIKESCDTKKEYCEENTKYPCCNTCKQAFVDGTGRYGYEGDWCLLKYKC